MAVCIAAAAPAASARAAVAEAYTFAFQDADIRDVVQAVLDEVGTPYAIDPGINGKLSFRIEQRLTKPQLLAALEAVLTANGVVLVRNGDQLIVTPQAKAKSTAQIRQGAAGAGQSGYEIVAVPLAYAQPSEVARALDAISESGTVLYSNDKLGLLLLAGAGQQLSSTLETLRIFDQSAFKEGKIRWFELNQAQASTVAAEIDRIVQGAGLQGVSVVPLKRLNGVIVFGRSAESLDEISKWVYRLDTAGREVSPSTLNVYRPRNTSAETLARTLSSVLGGQIAGASTVAATSTAPAPSGSSAPAAGSSLVGPPVGDRTDEDFRIGVDKDTNALLVFASAPKWTQVQRILNEIDRPARQVFIEATIVEVTLGKDLQYGVDWSAVTDRLNVTSVGNKSGTIGASFPGFSVTYLGNDISAALKALGSNSAVEVVSAPKIIALDNHTAKLQIGDQVPVIIQSQQSTTNANANLISTVDYRNTGVILSVTPRITGDDQLLLDVSQEVSSVAKTSTSGIDSPTIQQRRFESSLALTNGTVVALGGLISSTRSTSQSGMPGLQNVPVFGELFKTNTRSGSRSELVVLLSAKIVQDRAAMGQVMDKLLADMRELQGRGLLPKPSN